MGLPGEILPLPMIQEKDGSGKVNFGKNGIEGTRIWDVPWFNSQTGDSYLSFITRLLGYTISGPYNVPTITKPDVFSAELPFLFCQDIQVEGVQQAGMDGWGRIQYQRATITAKYMPYELGEHFHLASNFLTFEENTFSWIGPYTPPPSAPSIPYNDLQQETSDLQAMQRNFQQNTDLITSIQQQITTLAIDINGWAQIYLNGAVTVETLANNLDPINNWQVQALAGTTPTQGLTDAQIVASAADMREKVASWKSLKNQADSSAAHQANLATAINELQEQIQQDNFGLAAYTASLNAWMVTTAQQLYLPGVTASVFDDKGGGTSENKVVTPVGKIIPLGEYTVDRHQVVLPDFGLYILMLGCVNATYFLGFPQWTLLFHGLEGKRAILPNGSRCWDITLKFLFNPNGHNMLWRPSVGRWEVIASQKTSKISENWWSAPTTILNLLQGQDPDTQLHKYVYQPVDFSVFLTYY